MRGGSWCQCLYWFLFQRIRIAAVDCAYSRLQSIKRRRFTYWNGVVSLIETASFHLLKRCRFGRLQHSRLQVQNAPFECTRPSLISLSLSLALSVYFFKKKKARSHRDTADSGCPVFLHHFRLKTVKFEVTLLPPLKTPLPAILEVSDKILKQLRQLDETIQRFQIQVKI